MADTLKKVDAAGLLDRHRNWDIGFVDQRVGTMYNDNGALNHVIDGAKIPNPVSAPSPPRSGRPGRR